eukprot:365300-Chlamydomonas_euryale.AAC.8
MGGLRFCHRQRTSGTSIIPPSLHPSSFAPCHGLASTTHAACAMSAHAVHMLCSSQPPPPHTHMHTPYHTHMRMHTHCKPQSPTRPHTRTHTGTHTHTHTYTHLAALLTALAAFLRPPCAPGAGAGPPLGASGDMPSASAAAHERKKMCCNRELRCCERQAAWPLGGPLSGAVKRGLLVAPLTREGGLKRTGRGLERADWAVLFNPMEERGEGGENVGTGWRLVKTVLRG